jgi:hypothetical protein
VVDSRVGAMWHIEYITKVKSKFKSLDWTNNLIQWPRIVDNSCVESMVDYRVWTFLTKIK